MKSKQSQTVEVESAGQPGPIELLDTAAMLERLKEAPEEACWLCIAPGRGGTNAVVNNMNPTMVMAYRKEDEYRVMTDDGYVGAEDMLGLTLYLGCLYIVPDSKWAYIKDDILDDDADTPERSAHRAAVTKALSQEYEKLYSGRVRDAVMRLAGEIGSPELATALQQVLDKTEEIAESRREQAE